MRGSLETQGLSWRPRLWRRRWWHCLSHNEVGSGPEGPPKPVLLSLSWSELSPFDMRPASRDCLSRSPLHTHQLHPWSFSDHGQHRASVSPPTVSDNDSNLDHVMRVRPTFSACTSIRTKPQGQGQSPQGQLFHSRGGGDPMSEPTPTPLCPASYSHLGPWRGPGLGVSLAGLCSSGANCAERTAH